MKIDEAKKIINYLLDNNLELIERGQNKIAINLIGSPGIGKTFLLKEIAEDRGARYVRVELSSLEEIGDLLGLPVKEFVMIDLQGNEQWVTEKLIEEYIGLGYKLCPDCSPRMGYAIPAWVPKDPEQEVILVLDDYTRASNLFMQAIMSLIQFGEYISWKLPKKTHLLLTSNEDDGSANLSSLDSAQASRLINFKLDFDPVQYGKWMDENNFRNEVINFMLLNQEIFDQSDLINARTYTMFANAISGFKNFNDLNTLDTVDLIARGCFGNDTTIGSLFVTFVNNNLDKLLSAEQIFSGEWDTTSKKIEDNVYKDGMHRADIASVLTIRVCNYIENHTDKENAKKIVKRVGELFNYPKDLLTEDLLLQVIKKTNAKFPKECAPLLLNPKISAKILG